MRHGLFYLLLILACAFLLWPRLAHGQVIDYGPPQDVLGHWEFDLYDASGNERGTTSLPIYTGRTWTLGSATDLVAAVESGVWNITNITGTISLPTLAATSTLQSAGNASLASIDLGIPAALGQTSMANSMPVVLASDQSPVSIAATYNTALLSETSGTSSALQTNKLGELAVIGRNKSTYISGNATTVIKTGAGRLHGVLIGNNTTGGLLQIYDNTAGSGTLLTALYAGTPSGGLLSTNGNESAIFLAPLDIEFSTGLTTVTSGSTTNSFTIVWY